MRKHGKHGNFLEIIEKRWKINEHQVESTLFEAPKTFEKGFFFEDCGDLSGKNFAELRERLLVLDPLNPRHVARVNQAEADFWRRSTGERLADSGSFSWRLRPFHSYFGPRRWYLPLEEHIVTT